jgi:REP element-mobilizing transposase RayT
MPRPPRIELPHGYYHVCSKGNYGQAIFLDDFDRVMHESMLECVTKRVGWHVLAYCQMTNHFHLVLRLDEGGLSNGMCLLNGKFAQYLHRRYGRLGHLFGSRFHGGFIETEAHLLQSCAYAVNNPVRAGICAHAVEWPWSTYRATAGLAHAPRYLSLDELLPLFGRTPAIARRAYRAYVSSSPVPVPGTGACPGPEACPARSG